MPDAKNLASLHTVYLECTRTYSHKEGERAQRGSGEPERRRREATGESTVAEFIDP